MKYQLQAIPRWFWLPALLGIVFLVLPLLGMASRVPWTDLGGILTSDAAIDAVWLSLRTCVISTIICALFGTPLALILARASEASRRPRWLTPLRSFVLVPLVMPPVVAGLALLTTFGRQGLLGSSFEALGLTIPFTTIAVVLAQVFVSLPYLVMTVEAAARAAGSELEHAAQSLGASRWVQFSRITFPLLGPSLASGAALAFARSLGEFGATITFAGSLQGTTRTLPLEVYLQREQDTDTALALSLVLIVIALILTAVTTVLEYRNQRRFRLPENHTVTDPTSTSPTPIPATSPSDRPEAPTTGGTPWQVGARVPERGVDLDLAGEAGETLAIIGPNGAGKSTVLRLLAGDLVNSESTVTTPSPIGFLDQSPALFPHMSVLENVAFGPRCHGATPNEAKARAEQELTAVGLSDLKNEAPWRLSGGQAQRVALARMLAVDPKLLLLDEPFAALDKAAASHLRNLVAERTAGKVSTVVVTHDLTDIVVLADQVAVLEHGKLRAQGNVTEIIARPPTKFVAQFAGVNMFLGQLRGDELVTSEGLRFQGVLETEIDDGGAAAVFEPAAVALRKQPADGSPRNVWRGRVVAIQSGPGGVQVDLDIGAEYPLRATITAGAAAQLGIATGTDLWAEVKAMQVYLIAARRG